MVQKDSGRHSLSHLFRPLRTLNCPGPHLHSHHPSSSPRNLPLRKTEKRKAKKVTFLVNMLSCLFLPLFLPFIAQSLCAECQPGHNVARGRPPGP